MTNQKLFDQKTEFICYTLMIIRNCGGQFMYISPFKLLQIAQQIKNVSQSLKKLFKVTKLQFKETEIEGLL